MDEVTIHRDFGAEESVPVSISTVRINCLLCANLGIQVTLYWEITVLEFAVYIFSHQKIKEQEKSALIILYPLICDDTYNQLGLLPPFPCIIFFLCFPFPPLKL